MATERSAAKSTVDARPPLEEFETTARLLDGAKVILLWLDRDGAVVRYNDYMAHLSGYDLSEVQGQDWFRTFLPPEHREAVRDVFRRAISGTPPHGHVNPIVLKDGRLRLIEWYGTTLCDSDGQVIGVVSTGYDITERRHAEEALRESKDRLRAITDATFNVIYCMSSDWAEMRFLSGREFIADTREPICDWLNRYIPPDDQTRVMDAIRQALRTRGVFDLEHRVIRIDDSVGWTHSRAVPILDAHGEIIEWFGAAIDTTPQKDALAALREREDRLKAVLDTVVDAIITIDRQGVIQSANPATERLFGYTPNELQGENVRVLMPAPYRDEHDEYIARYLRTGEARIIGIGREVMARRKDGSTFAADLSVSEVGRLGLFVGSVRDISERKQAEEQLYNAERLSSIGTLAAGLGHDMNNVLLPVRARLDIIENTELHPATREQLTEIRKSISYMQDLTDGLHLLALDPDDNDDACLEATDLHSWWQQTSTLLRRALPKQVRFRESFDPALPQIVVQPHRLTQAVLNLLVNAGNAIQDRGTVRLWAERTSKDTVRIGVTDDGCGMPPEIRRRALEPFFTTKRRGLGTGLGLSLVQGIVRSAGGVVEVESEVNEGTTITLEFPIAHEDPGVESADDARPTALVTIQDERLRALAHALLEAAGLDVITGVSTPTDAVRLWITGPGREAVHVLRTQTDRPYEVVVLGEMPPGSTSRRCIVVSDLTKFDNVRAAIQDAAMRAAP